MARRMPTANGMQVNGDAPPPSTLAAQIVQNQDQTASRQNGTTNNLSHLLQELLYDNTAPLETNLGVNVQLIDVVAEACLAPLATDNPFAVWDELIPTAVDSIAVIEATIKRQPQTLFTPLPKNPDGPQLLLPLLARVATVCGRARCEALPITRLLDSIFEALNASIDLWQYAQTVRQVTEDCVNDIVDTFESATDVNSGFSVKLPPARSVAKLWPQSENAIVTSSGSQATLSHKPQAILLALELSKAQGLSGPWRNDTQARLQNVALRYRSNLEKAKQWDLISQQMLALTNPIPILASILDNTPKSVPSVDAQKQIAQSLVDALRRDCIAVHDHVLPAVLSLASDQAFETLHEDLRIAIATSVRRLCAGQILPERVLALVEALRQDNVMTDSALLTSFRQLSVTPDTACAHPRRRKRPKLGEGQPQDLRQSVIRNATKLLTGIASEDLTALPDVALNVYAALDENDKCAAWQALTDLSAVNLQVTLQTISRLIESPTHQSRQARVLSMLAVGACLEKTTDVNYLDVRLTFGQICLQSLQSSLRELRITAAQCLGSFLRNELPTELKQINRQTVLNYLRMRSDGNVACEQETLILAWGQVALICEDAELNLALLRLVDYLGHTNPLVSGVAFNQLERLAEARSSSVEELCRPFWSSIAVTVVQDLNSRPQKAQQFCDLLERDVNHFLVMTQQETLPTLVLRRKKDVLERIATARGKDTTVQDICLQPQTNLAAILALLLAQPVAKPDEAALACLAAVAPGFQGADITDLVKLDPSLIACNMLKHIGDQHQDRKSRAIQAFYLFAQIAERRPGNSRGHSKSSRAAIDFLDAHMLGIMTHFSTVLETSQTTFSTLEKSRCVKAIAEMINISQQQVNTALPQIRAALQSALEQKGLCEVAFSAWLDLLSVLDGADVAHLLDQSFALILKYWKDLPSYLKKITDETIRGVVREHNQVVKDNIMTLPSLEPLHELSAVASQIAQLKSRDGVEDHCKAFAQRLGDESPAVVLQALEELTTFLDYNQDFIHQSAVSEQPSPVLSDLLRGLLDATVKSSESAQAADLCGKALGIIGCLDPNRVEAVRKKRTTVVLSNFKDPDEAVDWVMVFLEDVLVKAFKSATNARAQGFLAFTIQELLRFAELNDRTVLRPRPSQVGSEYQKWMSLPEHVRLTLTPFVNSRYVVASNPSLNTAQRAYPSFSPDLGHSAWLRSLVCDLALRGKGENPKMVFPLLARITRGHDLAICTFLLPYAVLNVVLGGIVAEVQGLTDELLAILNCQPAPPVTPFQHETIRLCSDSVFSVLDYMSIWLQEKRKALSEVRANGARTGRFPVEFNEKNDMDQIDTVENFLASIPAELIATRAVTCGSYARALFHWEQYIRQKRALIPSAPQSEDDTVLYDKLQDIYAQIDEPDGLEGVTAHLSFLSEDQQAIQNAKAGRWVAAQSWYELQLAHYKPTLELEDRLLACFRETGRYEPLLKYADSFLTQHEQKEDADSVLEGLFPSIVEAHWMTEDLDRLNKRLKLKPESVSDNFNVRIAEILGCLKRHEDPNERIKDARRLVVQSMTVARTSSVQASHEDLKKLHVLHEIDFFCNGEIMEGTTADLDRRLAVLGSYVSDKQYVLGVRRAVLIAMDANFLHVDVGSSWVTTAKFARQSGHTDLAYTAVLRAHEYEKHDAKLEEAKLLWRDGHQRHAIQSLEAAIKSGIFETADKNIPIDESTTSTRSSAPASKQSALSGKIQLLHAKWLDASGQAQSNAMTAKYRNAVMTHKHWEKGHYYLGKHYQKILEAGKALSKEQLEGRSELVKSVVENYLRSIPFGNKYWHQTIPKSLTLWLDLGSQTLKPAKNEDAAIFKRRVDDFKSCTKAFQKFLERSLPYVYYSAMPQIISRITHPNPEVWKQLLTMLTRIGAAHPSQALWSLMAIVRASDRIRVERGTEILERLKDPRMKKADTSGISSTMIAQAQKLSDGLLRACEAPVEPRTSNASLSKDLGFSLKNAPSPLVVPVEMTLTANLPIGANYVGIKHHKAFVQNRITIQAFSDDVFVLGSLQRPRKVTVRGSDGKRYGLLCKPKDDLRKDQRLMEFNGIINRALKRDAESSKRRLYIKTYAVTPLSEESGIIEWVEGIKPIRDILLDLYNRRNVRPNYPELRTILDQASVSRDHAHIFTDKILSRYPAVMHEWFAEVYPEPETWFAARLRYARTAAVMSMTGYVLGLGDRHGENILLEESTGGVFHVDFNCLFDKGLTFDKPELVPFRLTHNMVDAMGPYGYEGPFRKSSELTLRLLRQSKDTLMTILETFLYDPTTDFVGKKKRTTPNVPETPQEILDSVERKLNGLLPHEAVPLSVEGHVNTLVLSATDQFNLASMYIGWCAFL